MAFILSHDAAEAVTIHHVPSQNTIRGTDPFFCGAPMGEAVTMCVLHKP